MKVKDIVKYIKGYKEGKWPEEGIIFGNPDGEVKKIFVCWMANLEAIKKAANEGCNLIVCHEELFYPYNIFSFGMHLEKVMHWKCNRDKINLLAKNNISVFRAHFTVDYSYIRDEFYNALNLNGQIIFQKELLQVVEIKQMKLEQLIEVVKKEMRIHVIRTAGKKDKVISKVGLAIGGIGLSFNANYMYSLIEYGVDAVIVGETDEYGFRCLTDSDCCVIETSHPISESFGLQKFYKDLKDSIPLLDVIFYEMNNCWNYM